MPTDPKLKEEAGKKIAKANWLRAIARIEVLAVTEEAAKSSLEKHVQKIEKDERLIVYTKEFGDEIKKLQEIRALNINPYPYKFDKKHDCAVLQQRYAVLTKEERTQDQAAVAGRIVALRRMGKITFSHILDGSGKIQLYFSEDALGAEKYDFLNNLDLLSIDLKFFVKFFPLM